MIESGSWLANLSATLPRHAAVITALCEAIENDPRLRWFSVSCSLGSGRGDELSDIDAGAGYADELADPLESVGEALVAAGGAIVGSAVPAEEPRNPIARCLGGDLPGYRERGRPESGVGPTTPRR